MWAHMRFCKSLIAGSLAPDGTDDLGQMCEVGTAKKI